MEEIIKILMDRDSITREDAIQQIDEVKDIILSEDPFDAADILMDELGLEPDWLEYLFK